MPSKNISPDRHDTTKKVVLITLLAMLLLVLGFHILLPLLGITIAISANLWGIAISAIIIMCVMTLLLFALTGIAVFIIGLLATFFVILAIALFPLLFPILVPLLLMVLAIAHIIRRKKHDKTSD